MGGYSPDTTEYSGKAYGFKVVGFDFSEGGMVPAPDGLNGADETANAEPPAPSDTKEGARQPVRVSFSESPEPARRKKKAQSVRRKAVKLPSREYTEIKDTATYKMLKGIGRFKAGSVVTVLLIIVCVVLGLACVMRYAAIFDLSKHTRQIEKENAKTRNRLTVEESSVDIGDNVSVDSIAARLGMIRPGAESGIVVPLTGTDVTRVYLSAEEDAEDDEEKGFYQSLLSFLGQSLFD